LFYLPDAISPWPAQTVSWAIDFTVGLFEGRRDLRDDVIRRLDLVPLLGRPMGKLSKGQRKRALLAIGLLMPQPLLIADEPFEGLDLRQTRDIALALRSYAGHEKRTMLLSIHQIGDAARVCDRFVLLSGGKVCGEGTLAELTAVAASRGRAVPAADLEEVFLALT
jgi:ABC-2 type transport system ATP-binding protein